MTNYELRIMNGGTCCSCLRRGSQSVIPHSHRGFTVLELLVASMLLGMLMTILTMIFSQSSIAWKTGVAGVSNMDAARKEVSDIRNQADNGYEWGGSDYYIHSVFKDDGQIATRTEYVNNDSETISGKTITLADGTTPDQSYGLKEITKPTGYPDKSYIVNVMSYGPDRKRDTRYDNVYSVSPSDDPSQW